MRYPKRVSYACAAFIIWLHPGTAFAGCVSNVTPGSTLSMRSGPGTSNSTIASIPSLSCRVAIDSRSCTNGWCRVFFDAKLGWASDHYLQNSRVGDDTDFNYYILKAIYETVARRTNRGYNLRRAYSEDLNYGAAHPGIKRFYWDSSKDDFAFPGGRGETMCVAAVAESLIEALNIYFSETGDTVPFSKLSRDHWSASAKANQLRQHLWEYEDLGSKGAAHALERFNIGKQTKFSELIPGDLFKINRTSGPGHSTVFIAYIDRVGNVLERYSDQVKGVLYFSAQETGGQDLNDSPSNGFGFRKEYFQGNCPDEEVRSANHCNIFPVGSDDEPNVGHMPHPKVWGDVGSNYRRELTAKAYLAQTGEPMPANFVGFMATLDANAKSALQTKVDLQLNKSLDPERFGNFEGP